MYLLEKDFTMCCAHNLYDKNLSKKENEKIYGKCCSQHGHGYKITLKLQSRYLIHGMIVNFNEIKQTFKQYIDDKFDHKNLNDFKEFKTLIPTAENMAEVFYRILKPHIKSLYMVEIEETEGAKASYYEG